MKAKSRLKQLLRLWLLIAAIAINQVGSAMAQEPGETQQELIYLPFVSTADATPNGANRQTDTNQIIIHYQDAAQTALGVTAQMDVLSEATGLSVTYVRHLADQSMVVSLPDPLAPAELQSVLTRIANLPDVEMAEPDLRILPQMTPNDPRYGEQWHYFAPTARNFGINLPGAWDITTGASNLIIAVLDTGQLAHEDIDSARIAPGYDLIYDLFVANDGDRRDPDPHDEGDAGCGQVSMWHGTHVAGTIGAKSNNGLGVTGINWNSKIQHVRVIGVCGGLLSDVIDGIYWAAGLSVPGVPNNPTPAKIINMSIGIAGVCGQALQNAINAAFNVGSVLIVSAGNDAIDAAGYTPASCNNVITVGATDRSGDLAFYSNYGPTVEIAAPGGVTVSNYDLNGILSTMNTGLLGPEADAYAFYQGTSMAAPHVSGVVSLMLSVNPSLTPSQILSILQSTATPFPAGSSCLPNNCGVGLVNAMAAVTKAKGGVLAPTNAQVTLESATQITLRWTDNTGDETGFKVERCQNAGCTNFTQIATLSANSTSYSDSGISANTSYRYRVRTTKNGVDSVPSNLVIANSGAAGCALYSNFNQGPTLIPDYGAIQVNFTVANHGSISDVNVRNLNIEHPFDMDLRAVLTSPSGRQVELFNTVGGAGANFSATTLDDEATRSITVGSAPFIGSYRPTSPLSALDGQATTGAWRLSISDNVGGYEGWFDGASLEFCSSGGSDLIFEDGFESGSFGRWTSTSTLDGGDLSVGAAAALVGTRGMSILIDDMVALYVTDDTPNAEARYRARFRFDPNSLVLPNGLAHDIFYAYQGASTVIMRLEFRINNGVYQLRSAVRNDSSTWKTSSWYTISDAPHAVEVDWRAATAAGANNGSLTLWLDGTQKGVLSAIDNDTRRVDRIRLGAIAGLDAGTQGAYYFDDFKSTRQNYIGPTAVAAATDETDNSVFEAGANVMEEDLSLDDIGDVKEDEAAGAEEVTPNQ
ncbi:MAG: S8 family serine peptidase [Caldilineaceae bacterium]